MSSKCGCSQTGVLKLIICHPTVNSSHGHTSNMLRLVASSLYDDELQVAAKSTSPRMFMACRCSVDRQRLLTRRWTLLASALF